ncbi:GNAT family N-acetyltransferase [Aureibacter tunicatorum]|uniref:N-acetylglutamate synthase-like GNAT family acetyltransferase n=1 Tax=Aureibacter tunicatorum TaxID=866807 RepID=A0AAE4BTL2_9BACT|nr:GNAT family N-acetyltransferase [Aureibacter tunicatorum]MDR6239757.1 N-acetylglutamate synthase-like GNAT family acetyltransferase [Aureibacter tunicatorum]BDD04233.1 N-acetyltransferase [Aureibacter tunicatorum]
MKIDVMVANVLHIGHAQTICDLIESSAKQRGTGIAKRKPEYVIEKMMEGKAVIAIDTTNDMVAGFCYIECWENEKYVANSGLIVNPDYRGLGLAKAIKKRIFDLSAQKFPAATIFGITTSPAVMKINFELGYRPATFAEITKDEKFWKGCHSCPNYDILQRTQNKNCLCTGMIYSPKANISATKKDIKTEVLI